VPSEDCVEIMENVTVIDDALIDAVPQSPSSGRLLRILGVGFGVAVGIGSTIGVGILRNPGGVAAYLGSAWPIIIAWALGGVYCLLSANYLAELATMIPKAGGLYVYAHRAFGNYGGFVVGWSDWINQTLSLAYISIVFGEYAASLFAPNLPGGKVIFGVSILVAITIVNMIGLRAGSETQKITSFVKAMALLGFVAACFMFGGQHIAAGTTTVTTAVTTTGFLPSLVAFILAFQLVLGTYDGWYGPVYFSEEDTNPTQNIPRSMFGGIGVIIVIYLLVNLALLYVLPMSSLAGSQFAGGDAMTLIFGARGGQIVTVLGLLSLIGIVNAIMMLAPRITFAMGRDGLFTRKAAGVNRGGTPAFALITTALCAIALTVVGTFELLLAIGQFFIVVVTSLLIVALFVLRRREPDLPRPFRTWGYPYTPVLMLVFSVLLAAGYIGSNPYPSIYAITALAVSYPVFRLVTRQGVS
jgi:APA family basic amino acid/polyamine antiporter